MRSHTPSTALIFIALSLSVLGCDSDEAREEVPDAVGPSDMGAPDESQRDAAPVEDMSVGDADLPPLISVEEAMAHVDLFIGSGGIGFNYGAMTPAAQRPNGLVRLGPDTTQGGVHPGFHHFSGYHFDDADVRGFSHTRFVGTGIEDFGNLRVLPQASAEPLAFTAMDKGSEIARPGYYSVRLPEVGAMAELTATRLGGLHRYTFDAPGWLSFDAASSIASGGVQDVELRVDGGALSGHVTYKGPMTGRGHGEGFTLWFHGALSPPPSAVEGPTDGRAALRVEAGPVELRVAISLIDGEQARANFDAEVAGVGFDDAVALAEAAWAERIGRLRVSAGAERDLTILYTALYHTYAMPSRLDEGGQYRGIDNAVHALDREGGYYTDLSLWDTFRTLHPWYTLFEPELQRDCLNSLLDMARDGGAMPRWPAATTYGGSMIGSSADHLFAGSALKGIEGVDYAAAFDVLWIGANGPTPYAGRRSIEDYLEHGYVPSDHAGGSVSRTVEYAWSDASLSGLASLLGREAEAESLWARGQGWRRLLDPATGFLAPRRSDGDFEQVRPTAVHMDGEGPYVEGSAWHWRFSAFQSPASLAEAIADVEGDPLALGAALDAFFERSGIGDGRWVPARPDPYYWHGNEPDLHAPWLYYAVDRPEDAQRWVRAIQQRAYGAGPDGLPGNDDGGTMSAWFLLTAVGLYPVAGTDVYYVAPPLFERAQLQLVERTLDVTAPGASAAQWRFSEAYVGERLIEGGVLQHGELLEAGRLRFAP